LQQRMDEAIGWDYRQSERSVQDNHWVDYAAIGRLVPRIGGRLGALTEEPMGSVQIGRVSDLTGASVSGGAHGRAGGCIVIYILIWNS